MAAPRPALPRVVELVRVSSAGQAERDTPADQGAALDRLRLSRPCQVVERITQQVSGAAAGADRPDLIRLAELAALRAFDEVRVRHLDRLTRHEDLVERAAIFSMVKRAGAVIVDAAGAVLDPATLGGELLWVVSTMASAQERTRILERTLAGKRRLAAQGRLVSSTPPWGRTFDKATGRWGLDEPAAALYRRLFDLVLRGRPLRAIAEELNLEGTPAPRGGRWSWAIIGNLVRAPHAAGRGRSHGAEFPIPPIVDPATQAAAVARLRANDRSSGRHDVSPALLRKIAVCGVCGAPLYTDRHAWKDRIWTVYYCSSRGDCRASHRVELVDQVVRAAVEAWLRRPGPLLAAASAGSVVDEKAGRAEAAAAARDLRRLDREEERVGRLLVRGQLRRQAGEKLLEEGAARRAAAERRAESARAVLAAASRWADLAGEVEARVAKLRRGIDRAGFSRWRELVELLFPPGSVSIDPSGHIRGLGRLALAEEGEAALQEARRELSPPSPTGCQIPVRLTAWAKRRT